MKNILMITASVTTLVAVGGLASAQDLNEHRERPAAAAPEQKAPTGKTDRQNLNAPQKSESVSTRWADCVNRRVDSEKPDSTGEWQKIMTACLLADHH
jgi:hypothetical protein